MSSNELYKKLQEKKFIFSGPSALGGKSNQKEYKVERIK